MEPQPRPCYADCPHSRPAIATKITTIVPEITPRITIAQRIPTFWAHSKKPMHSEKWWRRRRIWRGRSHASYCQSHGEGCFEAHARQRVLRPGIENKGVDALRCSMFIYFCVLSELFGCQSMYTIFQWLFSSNTVVYIAWVSQRHQKFGPGALKGREAWWLTF